jgi:hypothetical protein
LFFEIKPKTSGGVMKTENLSHKTISDALSVAGGIYRMNASSSVGYAFTKNRSNTAVNVGEFIFAGEIDQVSEFDGFIDFRTNVLKDMKSGECIAVHAK